jgi:hypothetical protein
MHAFKFFSTVCVLIWNSLIYYFTSRADNYHLIFTETEGNGCVFCGPETAVVLETNPSILII